MSSLIRATISTENPVPSAPRCRMAFATASGESIDDITLQMRARLRVVALIALIPFIYFLLFDIINDEYTINGPSVVGGILQGAVLMLTAILSMILWSKRPLTGCSLRRMELLIFGSTAVFFGWLQYCQLKHARFLDWVIPGSEAEYQVFLIVSISLTLRWFFLIVLYGVFIPNTWQRCTAMIGIAFFLALGITVVTCLTHERLRPLIGSPLVTMAVILTAASAIAVFGSSRIYSLHEEASKAKQLGQYRLIRKIGAGGMGEVYLAEHMMLRRPCALKLIRSDQARDQVTLSRFEREVKAMAKLTHWNTVEVYDYGRTEDGQFYYVMEYLPGLSLEAMIEQSGALPPERVVHFLRQICQALREAHFDGLLHRDIKPSNVIACERGGVHDVAKLLDFGLVHSFNIEEMKKLTIQGTILGSPPYMSPEQARGKSDLTAASDIYGLGCVGYFLLSGQTPFVRETAMEMLIAHASEPVHPIREVMSEVPSDLEAVILRCLEKKPEARFQSVHELEEALNQCACASQWSEERASQWWQQHSEKKQTATTAHSSTANVETSSLEVVTY